MSSVVTRVHAPPIRLARMLALVLVLVPATHTFAQGTTSPPSPVDASEQGAAATTVPCASKPGEPRTARPTRRGASCCRDRPATAACLLGKTWGYDENGRLGVGRLQRRVRVTGTARRAQPETTKPRPPRTSPTSDSCSSTARRAQIYFRLFSYARYLNQKEPRPDLHRRLRQHADGAAAPGHPAEQVLPALLRLVPDAEVPLLPLRLVVERLAGRSGAGRRRRQPELRRSTAS